MYRIESCVHSTRPSVNAIALFTQAARLHSSPRATPSMASAKVHPEGSSGTTFGCSNACRRAAKLAMSRCTVSSLTSIPCSLFLIPEKAVSKLLVYSEPISTSSSVNTTSKSDVICTFGTTTRPMTAPLSYPPASAHRSPACSRRNGKARWHLPSASSLPSRPWPRP